MNGSTHLMVGAVSGLLIGKALGADVADTGWALMGGIVGGLLPDIDTVNSKIGRKLYPVSFVFQKAFGHRTLTHSLLFLFFFVYARDDVGQYRHVCGTARRGTTSDLRHDDTSWCTIAVPNSVCVSCANHMAHCRPRRNRGNVWRGV